MTLPIKKVVFPVAGLGTRFLPATKASPKEMLPIVDKPLIQYAVEEAIAAGVSELIFVTSASKRAIEDHFDRDSQLEAQLAQKGKDRLLAQVRDILPDRATCVYIRQYEALGLGHAVWCAREVVGDEPFAVILADDLIDGRGESCLTQMSRQYAEHECSILGVEQVPPHETHQYGIVETAEIGRGLGELKSIVEKPAPEEAPSTLGVVGRYILTPRIFTLLEQVERGAGGEIQLTDAIGALIAEERVLAYQFAGRRYDCGSKLGYLEATVEHALKHPELQEGFRSYLKAVVCGGTLLS